ncbi:hypothetical protein EXN66_Car005085 [Channa argus]|uniref:Uncharacterized protein n=1 Tax=Channa argus TaxID=215402 RepID=A0A6G1PGU6_CHAAH|nr:hypothetical protein EXN66_Car005085 [Channa argus]
MLTALAPGLGLALLLLLIFSKIFCVLPRKRRCCRTEVVICKGFYYNVKPIEFSH